MSGNRVQLLDCTLRDGGFGLEDALDKGLSGLLFTAEDAAGIASGLGRSGVDVIEIGAVETSTNDKRGMAIYRSLEAISKQIPPARRPGQICAAFYRGPDISLEDIPDCNGAYCDALRVVLRYSELRKSLDYCAGLAKKGYKIFIQPMVTMRYTDDELRQVIDAANGMGAYALYFVDSYGYMTAEHVKDFFTCFDCRLDKNIRIGFHAHNNMNMAFANALDFIGIDTERDIIVDSCCLGMGQGAGNLQTELIADHLNKRCGKSYDFDALLDACEIVNKYLGASLWGYSLTRLLPAINNAAYKFAVVLRERYKLSFVEINHILKNIPEEYRHRYTDGAVVELLKMFGHERLFGGEAGA